jgi:hypothetical protein
MEHLYHTEHLALPQDSEEFCIAFYNEVKRLHVKKLQVYKLFLCSMAPVSLLSLRPALGEKREVNRKEIFT